MMVAFPIALFTATVAALLAYVGTSDGFYYRAALVANVAGVAVALAATVPGAIDLFGLPRGSEARAAGIKHASFALLTTGIFAVCAALLWRNWNGHAADSSYGLEAGVPLAVGVAGLVTLVIVGVLGWSMVQTHHVGVKPTFLRPQPPGCPPDAERLATHLHHARRQGELHTLRH
jgi:uncharacterized membrane protein